MNSLSPPLTVSSFLKVIKRLYKKKNKGSSYFFYHKKKKVTRFKPSQLQCTIKLSNQQLLIDKTQILLN